MKSRSQILQQQHGSGRNEIVNGVNNSEVITKEKLASDQLRLFRVLLDNSNDGIEVIDPDTLRLIDVNETTCNSLGYTREELLSMSIFDIDPAFESNPANILDQFKQTGSAQFESVHRRKDGSVFPVEVNVKLIESGKRYAVAITRDITQRKQAEISLIRANRALSALSFVSRVLAHATNENELLSGVCRAIVSQSGYRMAWVGYVEQNEAKTIHPVTYDGDEHGYIEALGIVYSDSERGNGPCGKAVRNRETQIIQNIQSDPSMAPWAEAATKEGYVSIIALPLSINGNVFGVLAIYSGYSDAFDAKEKSLLEQMAGDMEFGVKSLRTKIERDAGQEQISKHLIQLNENLTDTIRAISTIVELRDPYTAGHQRRVAELAKAIAQALGLNEEEINGIYLAGTVHDIGKINIPAEILVKPTRLSELEYGMVKYHAQASHEILKGIKFSWPIAEMAHQHHERVDGTGYPDGLKGDDILLGARILAVADVVEAMSSHRPYRPGLGIDAALNEVKKGKSTLYDPTVVDACLKLFSDCHFEFSKA